MARDDPTIYMRIPAELKQQLEDAANENRRSVTAEVVARLQATFSKPTVARRTGPSGSKSDRLGMTSLQDTIQGSGSMASSAEKWLRIRGLERKNSAIQAEIAIHGAEIKRLRAEQETASTEEEKAALGKQVWKHRLPIYDMQQELAIVAAELDKLYDDVSVDAPGAGSLGSIDLSDE